MGALHARVKLVLKCGGPVSSEYRDFSLHCVQLNDCTETSLGFLCGALFVVSDSSLANVRTKSYQKNTKNY